MKWIYKFIERLKKSFSNKSPVMLAIVRRYADANGCYVGELYIYGVIAGIGSYRMIGASLDSLPFSSDKMVPSQLTYVLDTAQDFLAPMAANTVRVGALEPADNDSVRRLVASFSARPIKLVIQNGFIEHVMAREPRGRP